MVEFLKKAAKPLATAAMVILGVGITAWMTDLDNWFKVPIEPLCGPWNNPDFKKHSSGDDKVTLRAEDLMQLRWMSVGQLRGIFNGRRGQFKIESSPKAYQQLRWMSEAQIEAIFGTTDIPQ